MMETTGVIRDAEEIGKPLWCLAQTMAGDPTHPLARGKSRVPDDAPLRQFQP